MIKSFLRVSALTLLVLTLVVAVLMATAWSTLPLDGVAVRLHDETFSLADLHGVGAGLFFVLAVVATVIGIVAILTMVLGGLGIGVLGLAFGLLATAASLALVVAPFALVGWLVWRALRTRPAASAIAVP